MKLVIVESPTKARTIRKFLGSEYQVESCMGHIRDLPQSAKDIPEKYKKEPWSRLGVDTSNNFSPIYCVPNIKKKLVRSLKDLVKECDELILATDEDREGESISWHLVEVLKPKVSVKRMVFHEITQKAIQKATREFRNIDMDLVKAQEARRILDRLVGYTLSPLLWSKVAYGLSAGRVQSVAVGLITQREHERVRFISSNYWGVYGSNKKGNTSFSTRLWTYKGQRVASGKDFHPDTGQLLPQKEKEVVWLDEKMAQKIQSESQGKTWSVENVEEKPIQRKPPPPFITSTLQQEANRKLKMSTKETMQVAQKLYEQGHITYMRTDSHTLSTQAIESTRSRIQSLYGPQYVPPQPRTYKGKKTKGAQEAHEAIRPAGTDMTQPKDTKLRGMNLQLYELIWKRTLASQMPNAQMKQVHVKFSVGVCIFTASGQSVEFPGFLKVYSESHDDEQDNESGFQKNQEALLPQMSPKDSIDCEKVDIKLHETKPPARYTEASLVQVMEKEGIGRPSTYAPIISTIVNRGYVSKSGPTLVPSLTAMIVSQLLKDHLPTYVDLKFTTQMEDQLDSIASGEMDSLEFLNGIYFGPKGLLQQVEKQTHIIDPEKARQIQFHSLKGLVFKVGRYGAYVCRNESKEGSTEEQCASLPDLTAPADISVADCHNRIDQKLKGVDALGVDPETQEPIYVLTGRYGPYVQRGETVDQESRPKRTSLPQGLEPEDVKLDQALFLLSLPRELGTHPKGDEPIRLGIGRFGPYVVHNGDFRSIPKNHSLFQVDLKLALDLLARPKKGRGPSVLKTLKPHPDTQEEIQVLDGRYGPYVKMGKINASLPEDWTAEELSQEQALELLAPKLKKSKTTKKASSQKKTKKVSKKSRKNTQSQGQKRAFKNSATHSQEAEVKSQKKIIRRSRKGETISVVQK